MIEVNVLFNNSKHVGSCNNCNREMPLLLKYDFSYEGIAYNKLCLCEDCSAAIGHLHRSIMENHEPYNYNFDEITKSI